jgi:Periplasmic binding protein
MRVGACLSLTGRYAAFGRQAATALEVWRDMEHDVVLRVEDDGSERARLAARLPGLAADCDLLLGPYSTGLTRTAASMAAELGRLIWNHGGAGDDVQAMAPGHVVSVLTPAGRYAEPYLRHLARQPEGAPLLIAAGKGRFATQVAAGARADGLTAALLRGQPPRSTWDLLCAGSFEEDVEAIKWARALPLPPRSLCSVAAGVRRLASEVAHPAGLLGIAQWFPAERGTPDVGPSQDAFIAAYTARVGEPPDYPAVQAIAGAALAVHCHRTAGTSEPRALFTTAARLDLTTLFGPFRIDPATGLQIGHETTLLRWCSSSEIEPL